MSELQKIIQSIKSPDGERFALATLVSTEGSSYRRAGARMLIGENGTRVGSISGGCLESDVIERARKVMAGGGKSCVATYDTTVERDILFGTGSGCDGIVKISIEPIREGDKAGYLSFLDERVRNRQKTILATVCKIENLANVNTGARFAVAEEKGGEIFFNNIANEKLASRVALDSLSNLTQNKSKFSSYQIGDGFAEVFFELIRPPIQLFVFGAGDDAIPVARFAKELGWKVAVVDRRAAFAAAERFETVDAIIVAGTEQLEGKIHFDERSAAVILTHNFLRDVEIIKLLLNYPLKYTGLLGSKIRAEKIFRELLKEGIAEPSLRRIFSPVGIDLGAETPAEIALSAIAEVQAVMNDRTGEFLKNRRQPLHDQTLSFQSRKPNTEIFAAPGCAL